MKIHSIYDNQGQSFDRYTVYYKGHGTLEHRPGQVKSLRLGRGMSEHPYHPQGFGQMTQGLPGKHNGKKIEFKDLPEDCQSLVARDLDTTVKELLIDLHA